MGIKGTIAVRLTYHVDSGTAHRRIDHPVSIGTIAATDIH